MKQRFLIVLLIVYLISMTACSRTMDDVIRDEPSIVGTVIETTDTSILVDPSDEEQVTHDAVWVSLDVELEDSMTHFNIGDVVVVYYDGTIAESSPGQIMTVYAITLREPADRSSTEQ